MATLAPFGDVYLTSLEWLARARNRISAVLPEELLGLNAVAGDMAAVLRDAVCQLGADGDIAAVFEQGGVEADGDDALRALHDKGRKTQRNAGAEALPVQAQVHGTKL